VGGLRVVVSFANQRCQALESRGKHCTSLYATMAVGAEYDTPKGPWARRWNSYDIYVQVPSVSGDGTITRVEALPEGSTPQLSTARAATPPKQ
jgi:hypothetical protein